MKRILQTSPESIETHALANTEWDFQINLFSSKKILSVECSSHKLEEYILTEYLRNYRLSG